MLLDIEGTTTPISFVHQRLFPYARARAGEFLQQHASDRGDSANRLGPPRPAERRGQRRDRPATSFLSSTSSSTTIESWDRSRRCRDASGSRDMRSASSKGKSTRTCFRPSSAGPGQTSGLQSSPPEAFSRSSCSSRTRRPATCRRTSASTSTRPSEQRAMPASYRRIVEALDLPSPGACALHIRCRSGARRRARRRPSDAALRAARFPDSRTERSLHRRNVRRPSSLTVAESAPRAVAPRSWGSPSSRR